MTPENGDALRERRHAAHNGVLIVSIALDGKGRIDHRECMLCLDCMVLYTDDHACPPLAHERKRRAKDGLPLTPIGRDGYYIPIKPVAPAAPRA